MRNRTQLIRSNLKHARVAWGHIPSLTLHALEELTRKYRLSVALGDVYYIDERWYVTHAGLLRLAERTCCSGIRVRPVREFCDSLSCRWVFKAIVYKTPGSKGFVGYGDADPSNVSPVVRGAEMRVAETRAVNRALRKAYGIGLCSVEELGWLSSAPNPPDSHARPNKPRAPNDSKNGRPRLRDQLCLLIRQYNLDPTLVKAHAADFCGTQTLKEASRDLVESFISHLAASAKEDREGLVCKLNSYAQPVEVKQ
jgi:hypothetical protein